MVVFESRFPSVYSLQQLEDESAAGAAPLGKPSNPQGQVSAVVGQYLPKIMFGGPPQLTRLERTAPDFLDYGDTTDSRASTTSLISLDRLDAAQEQELVDSVTAMSASDDASEDMPLPSLLDSLLLAEWEDRAQQGLFRYDVTACPTKPVPGVYGFVAQFNEGRASKKRPTEFRVDQVVQAFNADKFHFGKALQTEVLFQFEPSPVQEHALQYTPEAEVSGSPNLVFINVSPIEYGHVLLVPRALDMLPQLADAASVRLALRFCAAVDNPFFRLAFNSLGAYATINHLHFQAYYLATPFAIERAPTRLLPEWNLPGGEVTVSALEEYPVRGLVFETTGAPESMGHLLGRACKRMAAANIPHNFFVADRGQRAWLLPNAFAASKAKGLLPEHLLDSQVDPAGFEIAGHLILKRQVDYDQVDQEWVWKLLSHASVSEPEFKAIVQLVMADDPAPLLPDLKPAP